MSLLRFLVISVGLVMSLSAKAEYRVFILKIEDKATGQSRSVTTTLDHLQYSGYYPVRTTEAVSIQETWMCRNRSDRSQDIEQKFCPNPKTSSARPANFAAPKA